MDRAARPLLLIEDDPGQRRALADLLSYDGYAVTAVSDAAEALLRLHEQEPPGLILLDLELAGTGGWSFLRMLQDDPRFRGIPTMVLVGPEGIREAGEFPNVCAVLPRPPFVDALLAAVQQWYQPTLRNG